MVRVVRRLPALSILLALLLVSGGVAGAASREPPRPRRTRSVAVGSPSDGRLEHGVRLGPTAHLHFKHASPVSQRWGTEELVSLIRSVARRVADALPGASLPVGDLSRRDGGPMQPHLSHRNGRDVDLAFYLADDRGRPARSMRLVRVRHDGTARHLRFDDRRNWKLVESLLTDPSAQVEAILVAAHVERRLLAEARRRGAPPYLYERARLVMYQPRRGGRHDDHFHVRIHCPSDDRPRCLDGDVMLPILPPFAATLSARARFR